MSNSNIIFNQGRKADGSANAHAVNVTMKRKYRYDNKKDHLILNSMELFTGQSITALLHRG